MRSTQNVTRKKAAHSHGRLQRQSSVETKCFASEAGGFKKTLLIAREGCFFEKMEKKIFGRCERLLEYGKKNWKKI